VTVSWTGPDPIAHPDFTGYHVFRCDKSVNLCGYPCVSPSSSLPAPGWAEQTGAYIWQEEYTDTVFKGLQPGHSYAYCIQVTDCYYEENRWTWPQPGDDSANDPKDNFSETIITDPSRSAGSNSRPGMPDAVTGYLLPSTSLLPFTESAADGLTPVYPSFQHNTVTFWLRNTAASTVTLQQLTPRWENAQALIRKFAFGTDRPRRHHRLGRGVRLRQPVGAQRLADPVGRREDPRGGALQERRRQPLAADRLPQQTVEFTLNYRNDSTSTDGCAVTDSFYVPLGPMCMGRPRTSLPRAPAPGRSPASRGATR